MKVGIFADGLWGLNLIKILLLDKSFYVDFIVLRKKKDRKILDYCKKNKIPTFSFTNINLKKNITFLKKFDSDILVSMSYNQIFNKNFLKFSKNKLINCHAGALPYYRGRSPINWAIINGEKKIGITTHLIDKKIDQGDILQQNFLKVKKKDDFKSIQEKCFKICPKQVYAVLKKIKYKRIIKIKQKNIFSKGSYYNKRKNGDELIDFNNNYENLNNFIRGIVFPSVGATFYYKKKKFITLKSIFCEKIKKDIKLNNGIILDVKKNKIQMKISNAKIYLCEIFRKKNNSPVIDCRKIFQKNLILKGKNV
jgi:methionyl-tRNA formyltransferase